MSVMVTVAWTVASWHPYLSWGGCSGISCCSSESSGSVCLMRQGLTESREGIMFARYIGIDYSGAGMPARSNRELAVCSIGLDGNDDLPPNEGGTNWSRDRISD